MTEDETRPDPALVDVVAREMRQHRITITNGASKWTWGSDWVWRCGCGSGRDDSASHLWETCLDEASGHQARAVLTALSAAGRLLPADAREEFGYEVASGNISNPKTVYKRCCYVGDECGESEYHSVRRVVTPWEETRDDT